MSQDGPTLDKVIDQVRKETGARMVVLGEMHDAKNTIQYIRDSLPDLKAKGINTLYLELPANIQPMMDKALQGDEKSQRELRLNYERWWGVYGGTEGAQQRYDMIFEANKAGIRVKCADMDELGDSMHRYNDLDDTAGLEARMAFSNPVIANNIRKMDDGKGAVLLIGAAHTYSSGVSEHLEQVDEENIHYYKSGHGGIDEQLNDKGIPSASVDFTNLQGNDKYSLEKQEEPGSSTYIVNAPYEENETNAYNQSGNYRVGWNRMANVFEKASITAEVSGDIASAKIYTQASRQLATLPRLLDDPKFTALGSEDQNKKLMDALDTVSKAITPAEQRLTDTVLVKAAQKLHGDYLLAEGEKETPEAIRAIQSLVSDNEDLHLSGASRMWVKPPASLAGEETSGLKKEWKAAQEAMTPLDRTPEKAQIANPAVQLQTKPADNRPGL